MEQVYTDQELAVVPCPASMRVRVVSTSADEPEYRFEEFADVTEIVRSRQVQVEPQSYMVVANHRGRSLVFHR